MVDVRDLPQSKETEKFPLRQGTKVNAKANTERLPF